MVRCVMKRVSFWPTLVLLCSVMPMCASAQYFSQVPGSLTSISVGGTPEGAVAVWGINSALAQNIFEFDGQAFQNVPGNLTQIAVDGAAVWGINANGSVFTFDPDQARFVQIPGNLSQIAAHGGSTWESTPIRTFTNTMARPSCKSLESSPRSP